MYFDKDKLARARTCIATAESRLSSDTAYATAHAALACAYIGLELLERLAAETEQREIATKFEAMRRAIG